jgi:hypothetical protein
MNLHEELPLQKKGRYPDALKARIIELAKKQGGTFSVSSLYRDYVNQNACKQLKKAGVFKQTRYGVFEGYKLTTRNLYSALFYPRTWFGNPFVA